MSKTLYMVMENFRNGDAVPVYRRFRDRGGLAPAGLSYVSSWVSDKLDRCYQLMETEDRALLDQWIDENANAMVARVLLELRERNIRTADVQVAPDQAASVPVPSNGHSVSDNLLADRLARANVSRRHD